MICGRLSSWPRSRHLVQSKEKWAALGMGSSSGVSLEELVSLADKVLLKAGLKRPSVIATISTKQGDPVWAKFAQHYGSEEETPKLKHPSDVVFAMVGCHGVAESAALAAAGDDAELLIGKTTSECATAAIAVTRSV